MPYFSTDDNCGIYFEEYGDKSKKPVVLIHGHGGSVQFFKKQIPEFSKHYHVIAYDLRGHGVSDKANRNLTVPQLARDLNELMNFCGLKKAALVGWSMGASVLLEYIRQFGCDNLSNVVIVDNTAKMINDDNWKYGSFESTKEGLAIIIDMAKGWKQYAEKIAPMFFGDGTVSEEEMTWVLEKYKNNTNETMLPLVISNISSDFTDVLPQITVPALITYGKRKSFYDPKISYGLAERIPNASVAGFDGGHIHFFQDAERFNRTVIEFLAK